MNLLKKIRKFFSSLSPGRMKKRKKKKRTGRLKRRPAPSRKEARKPSKAAARHAPVKKLRTPKKTSASPKKKTAPAKRPAVKNPVSRKPKAGKAGAGADAPAAGVYAGTITHYFPKVHAAVVKLESTLALGESILIAGQERKLRQKVKSLQINRIPIDEGRPGEEVGLEVKQDVMPGDKVYKLK